MSKLFEYSKPVEGQLFIGRKEEVRHLSDHFLLQTNAAIVAPQGWGKSSLVRQAYKDAVRKERNLKLVYLSLSTVRNEERFYELLVQSVLRTVSSSQSEVSENVRRYFPDIHPKVGFKSDSTDDLAIEFDWEEIRKNQDFLLKLPSVVAADKDCRFVVCVDDFHSVSLFNDPDTFASRINDIWGTDSKVTYCICGAPNAFFEKFISKTPVLKYGKLIRLSMIGRKDTVISLRDRFADSGKYLDDEMAELIIDLADNHPFYIQQIAHLSWMGTSVVCSRDVVTASHSSIVDQMGLVFENLTESLTSQQLCYLHAVLAGESIISTSEVLHRHHITSATSASRSKAALLERGMVCIRDGKVSFTDPLYAYWLNNRYFK